MNFKEGTISLACTAVFFNFSFSQTHLFVASLNYESSPLAAPVVVLIEPSDLDNQLTFGIFGWTLHSDYSQTIDPQKSLSLSAELTPINSHSSNTIYSNGKEDPGLEYKDATLFLTGGMTIKNGENFATHINALLLYEQVSGISDNNVTDFWKNPYGGIGIKESYTNTVSDNLLLSRWDGIKSSVEMQLFAGREVWWRGTASIGLGQKTGPLFFRENVAFFLGNSLNVVSRFLIGGSWDILGPSVLYGHPYAEFRLDRAALVNSGVAFEMTQTVELAFNGAYLNSPAKKGSGGSMVISKTFGGINCNVGISISEDRRWKRDTKDAVVFAGIDAALFQ